MYFGFSVDTYSERVEHGWRNRKICFGEEYYRLRANDISTKINISLSNDVEQRCYATKDIYKVFNEYNKKYEVFGVPIQALQ